jgi:hypothetical protein
MSPSKSSILNQLRGFPQSLQPNYGMITDISFENFATYYTAIMLSLSAHILATEYTQI